MQPIHQIIQNKPYQGKSISRKPVNEGRKRNTHYCPPDPIRSKKPTITAVLVIVNQTKKESRLLRCCQAPTADIAAIKK